MRRFRKKLAVDIAKLVALPLLSAVIISVLWINGAKADGGTVQFTKSSGPFAITLFTTPSPLRAGPVDISLMIQDIDNQQPLLDCVAEIQLRKEGASSISAAATHEAAQNKLFYAAQVKIPEAGLWEVEAIIRRGDDTARVAGSISFAASNPVLLVYWRSLSIPPIFISLFGLNQWLKRRRTAGRSWTGV